MSRLVNDLPAVTFCFHLADSETRVNVVWALVNLLITHSSPVPPISSLHIPSLSRQRRPETLRPEP